MIKKLPGKLLMISARRIKPLFLAPSLKAVMSAEPETNEEVNIPKSPSCFQINRLP